MTANQVTVLGWVTAISAAALYGIGNPLWVRIAAAVLFANYLLDLIDGNIARFRNTRTHYGNYLDAVGDAIRFPLCTLGLAVGIHRHLDLHPLAQALIRHTDVWILMLMAGLSAILSLLDLYLTQRLDRHYKWITLQKMEAGATIEEATAPATPAGWARARTLLASVKRFFQELQLPVWIVLSFLYRTDWLLAWLFISAVVDSGTGILANVLRARAKINYPRP
jgi:phosphatidylglycerophosphate synthase